MSVGFLCLNRALDPKLRAEGAPCLPIKTTSLSHHCSRTSFSRARLSLRFVGKPAKKKLSLASGPARAFYKKVIMATYIIVGTLGACIVGWFLSLKISENEFQKDSSPKYYRWGTMYSTDQSPEEEEWKPDW